MSRINDIEEIKRLLRDLNNIDTGTIIDENEQTIQKETPVDKFIVGEIVKFTPLLSNSFFIGEVIKVHEKSLFLKPLSSTQKIYADRLAKAHITKDGLYEAINTECSKFLPNMKEFFKWKLANQ